MELPAPTDLLTSLYRFALLLTGVETVAKQTVLDAWQECAPRLDSFRNAEGRAGCLYVAIRQRCLRKGPVPVEAAATAAGTATAGSASSTPADLESVSEDSRPIVFARKIAALPEPDRSALALFYLHAMPARELASLLKLSLEDLSAALERGRQGLRDAGFPAAGSPAGSAASRTSSP